MIVHASKKMIFPLQSTVKAYCVLAENAIASLSDLYLKEYCRWREGAAGHHSLPSLTSLEAKSEQQRGSSNDVGCWEEVVREREIFWSTAWKRLCLDLPDSTHFFAAARFVCKYVFL